ncbi:MAG: acyl-CoA thioesterase [Chitinophagia bacterium]|jgi:acyl-CoA thioester hydrolase|nr:acyl-CoA thioesterase [Chitinophagia bacterium]
MRKNKILIPTPPCFETVLTVQTGDINYGRHVGNERYLLFAQEARLRFFDSIGCSEMKFGEFGLVLAEAELEYFHELFYGEIITIALSVDTISRASFECFYSISVERENKKIIAAVVVTKMVCFDYTHRKVKSISEDLRAVLHHCTKGM